MTTMNRSRQSGDPLMMTYAERKALMAFHQGHGIDQDALNRLTNKGLLFHTTGGHNLTRKGRKTLVTFGVARETFDAQAKELHRHCHF